MSSRAHVYKLFFFWYWSTVYSSSPLPCKIKVRCKHSFYRSQSAATARGVYWRKIAQNTNEIYPSWLNFSSARYFCAADAAFSSLPSFLLSIFLGSISSLRLSVVLWCWRSAHTSLVPHRWFDIYPYNDIISCNNRHPVLTTTIYWSFYRDWLFIS